MKKYMYGLLSGLVLSSLSAYYTVSAAEVGQIGPENVYTFGTVTVEAPRPKWEDKLSPGTVTVIEPAKYKGEQKTLPDLLKEVPGVHIREVNGKGQYTTVTVRGSTAAQVGVFVDGVLSNLGGDSAVDISTIPIKNVERIEVYRGYIPSRFGGTFIGGVINIVTKKPKKPDVVAEIGKSSYGGKSISGSVTMPLGSGNLMVSGDYESSDGDFRYDNYAAERAIPDIEHDIAMFQRSVDNFAENKITTWTRYNANSYYVKLDKSAIDYYKAAPAEWDRFIRSDALENNVHDQAVQKAKEFVEGSGFGFSNEDLEAAGLKERYAAVGVDENMLHDIVTINWDGDVYGYGVTITDEDKEKIAEHYIKRNTEAETETIRKRAIIEGDPSYAADAAKVKEGKKKLSEAEQKARWRKYNSYENSSAFVKWQNNTWMVKGAWNHIDRYLPDSLWGGDANSAVVHYNTDLYDTMYFDARHQKLTNSELLVQNRHDNGNLEWGWMADYTHQKKSYRAENIMRDASGVDFELMNIPLREWSKYTSNKYNFQIDGTYRLSENNMLDFQSNYSHERLHVDGSLMDKVLGDSDLAGVLGQTRNRYDQDILNIQLQDTITSGTWQFTPSIRYNRSSITGYSDGKRFDVNQKRRYHWIHPKDQQTDDKVTWQMGIKKTINDKLKLRSSVGTYFRLLNMYEIAGDGAGILPAPYENGRNTAFPRPEYGKQFDFSVDWDGNLLHARNSTTLTFFWRKSDRMLQLVRFGKDYWSYLNDNRGKVHGIEFQSTFNWDKVELDVRATYTKSHLQRKNSAVNYDYSDVWATFQPEWESNVRLTYYPTKKWAVFGEMHYTDDYFTSSSKDSRGGEYAILSGRPVSSLTVYNAGVKWKPSDDWQITVGCNDIFNHGPKQKIRSQIAFTIPGYINPEFPHQGRTYYATVRYQF